MKSHAVRIHQTGGPEVLRYEEMEVPAPGPGEVLLRQTAVGLNFIDTYHRSGLYPVGDLPAVLGSEASGVVEEIGPGVEEVSPGDRVAYALSRGAYAERRTLPAGLLVPLSEAISDEAAAALMLKGLTAEYLVRRTFPVKAGHTVLIHAAAGGVGSLLCQWCSALGARVIGTAGSADKAAQAREHGCETVILYDREAVAPRVLELTDGGGVDVVYDGVGAATFDASLDALARRGMLVTFGNASGPVPPLDLLRLSPKSVFVTRPSLAAYVAERAELLAAAEALFRAVADGHLRVRIDQRFPLAEAEAAHRALEARETTGSTVLLPGGSAS